MVTALSNFMTSLPILSVATFLPLVGATFIILLRGNADVVARQARYVALWTTLLTFVLSLFIWVDFEVGTAAFQFEERFNWLRGYRISYHMGVDGISMLFVILTAFLMPICVLASWESITKMVKEYMAAFLLLETMMIGMFCALDMVLFYVFFEGVLIPMFLIIGVWGGGRRVYSAFKFFLYTLTGSVLLLVAMLAMYFQVGTTDIPDLMAADFSRDMQYWLWAGHVRVLRGQDTHVAGAYVVARCARGRAHGWICYLGWRAVENGRLWLPAVLTAHAS